DVVTAMAAIDDLPVTAEADAAVVTFTARNKGTQGNGIDIRVGYYREDALPAGVTAAVVAMASGATDPAIASAIAAIADEAFDLVVIPWTSSANLVALEAELADRWAPPRMLDGLAFAGARGSAGTLATLGDGRNSRYVSIIGANLSPTPPWEWAAAVAGRVAHYGGIDPARPFQTLTLPGVLPPLPASRFTRAERELLLRDGISTFTVDPGGVVAIERVISTYQVDSFGAADTSWLDINTPLTLSYMRWSWRARMLAKFPRAKLASDGTMAATGAAIVTPRVAKAETIAWARDLAEAGLLENVDQFIADLVVERDASDQSRLNVRMAPDIVNQARVFAAQIQFLL
ncbi:MAG: phage tail sheath subtilisin-like domain-containing protein, partial [Reyranella sp.]|nr:phage tail sheath subtilisin-like domain-containing protein [Reyranella sp.]